MIAYLSGAMEFSSDEGAGWRKDLTLWLDININHKVLNPVVESENLMKSHGAESYRE